MKRTRPLSTRHWTTRDSKKVRPKKLAVLGATGSIGRSALDVIERGKGDFAPVLFTAHTGREALLALKAKYPGAALALSGVEGACPGVDYTGENGLIEAIAASGAEIALNGIAGAAGLRPSLACLEAGMDLALANKETIVMAGPLVFETARRAGRKVIPVDSEHSAVFHLIEAHGRDSVAEVLLTASGGPFRGLSHEELAAVTPAQALAHPTWNMGPKITVDSASLANKGLEVIEAARLFGFPPEKIRVVIHPQSIVHSMIRLEDGAVYAQLSRPDMRLPIHEALYWPESAPSPFGALDFENLSLNFEKPDPARFPMLPLAYEALKSPLGPAAYNAANEEAVAAFLAGRLAFTDIPRVVGRVLRKKPWTGGGDLETILAADKEARNTVNPNVGSEIRLTSKFFVV